MKNLFYGSGFDFNFENFWNYSQMPDMCKDTNKPNTLFATFILFIVGIGMLGNILVFFSLVVLKEYKKTVTNWYYLHLTVADTLFLLMLPFTALSEFNGKWNFSLNLCKFKEAILFVNYYASIYFLVAMSFDRYLAVTKVFSSTKWRSRLRSPLACHVISSIGWTISVLLCIPLFQHSTIDPCDICAYSFPVDENRNENYHYSDFMNEIYADDSDVWTDIDVHQFSSTIFEPFSNDTADQQDYDGVSDVECRLPVSSKLYAWVYGNFVGAFIVPLALICFFYGTILQRLSKASHIERTSRQRRYKRRVTMAVLALISVFIVSWLPWYVEKLSKVRGIPLSPDNCNRVRTCVRAFAYLNSALNPYIYSFWKANFRRRVSKVSSKFRVWLPCTLKKSVFDATNLKSINVIHVAKEKKQRNILYSKNLHCHGRKSSVATNKTERTIV